MARRTSKDNGFLPWENGMGDPNSGIQTGLKNLVPMGGSGPSIDIPQLPMLPQQPQRRSGQRRLSRQERRFQERVSINMGPFSMSAAGKNPESLLDRAKSAVVETYREMRGFSTGCEIVKDTVKQIVGMKCSLAEYEGKRKIDQNYKAKEDEEGSNKPKNVGPLTTNRDNIGKPMERYVPLIPHLAHCGDNVLLWGESKIGKSRLGFQWGIDLAQGHYSSLFPFETCLTPRHYVFYYAYELDEQDIRERYGTILNQYENLQIIYASSRIGNPDSVLEDLKGRLKSVPEDAYVAVFFDTFAKAVGWGHAYDEKKAGEFLDKLMKLQDDFKASQNITISNIIIAHQKNDKDELEGPNCIRQSVKTELRFIMKEKHRKYLLEHLRANNMKTLDEPLHLHVEEELFVRYVADEDGQNEVEEDVENPFKENGDYDWKKLAPLLKKLTNEGKSQKEIAETLTEKYGKETNQQSVSAAMQRLGIKPSE